MNWFGSAALEAAYNESGNYMETLCDYVNDNMDYMVQYIQERLPMIRMKNQKQPIWYGSISGEQE